MVEMPINPARLWLWAMSIGGGICGAPSMFFLFFHPLMVIAGFILGMCLGGLWAAMAIFLFRRSLLELRHFCVAGAGIGLLGTAAWGFIFCYHLQGFDGWAPVFIGSGFLILTVSGLLGSIVGRMRILKGADTRPNHTDAALAVLLICDFLFFMLIPALNSSAL